MGRERSSEQPLEKLGLAPFVRHHPPGDAEELGIDGSLAARLEPFAGRDGEDVVRQILEVGEWPRYLVKTVTPSPSSEDPGVGPRVKVLPETQ